VFSYLAIFRLDELGEHYQGLVLEVNENMKLYKLLSFLTNENHFNTWIRDEWRKVYDRVHIDENILQPYMSHGINIVQSVYHKLHDLMNDLPQAPASSKPTVPQPFEYEHPHGVLDSTFANNDNCWNRLTKPKPRVIAMPEAIPALAKPNPIPKSTYTSPLGTIGFTNVELSSLADHYMLIIICVQNKKH
jgi:hypothetical protein